MNRDKETIYELLIKKLVPLLQSSMTLEQITDLDGVLWDLAYVLCDENAPKESEPKSFRKYVLNAQR